MTTSMIGGVFALLAAPLAPGARSLAVEGPDTVLAPVQIQEWEVPWADSRPRDPFPDRQGRIWFVGQRSDYVGVLDPATGEFRRFPLEEGTGPHNLIVDEDGFIWYAGNRNAHIGRLDPEDGSITRFPMPDERARDPHTLLADGKGGIWFTVQGGNFVGRLSTSDGEVRLLEVPTKQARPYGIVTDSRGNVWFNQFGTNRVGRVDARSFELRDFVLPDSAARGRRIAITSDDAVWYVDYARGYLARLDPSTGEVREWPAPGGEGSRPYALTVDDRDRLWFVESGPKPNRLVGFDPSSATFVSVTPIPSGGGTVRHMVFDPRTRDIWFGTDANTIGRARIPE